MNTIPTAPAHEGTEVLLRVQLGKVLSPADLTKLVAVSRREGSLNAAVTKTLQSGLAKIQAAKKAKGRTAK